MKSLLTECSGDWYFTGDLVAGKRAAQCERFVYEGEHRDQPVFWVAFCDDPVDDDTNPIESPSLAEWGAGESLDDAWRFALGALFGPADEEYDEARLRTYLDLLADPNPIPWGKS